MQKWMEQFNAAKVAVYFASADKKTQLVGFDCADELCNWSDDEILNEWLAKQTGSVFGGIPFDEQEQASEIMNGYFIAPKNIFDLTMEENAWLKSDVKPELVEKNEILDEHQELDWVTRMTPILETLREDETKKKVVLGMQSQLSLAKPLDVSALLTDLQLMQPNAYHFVLKRGEELFVSATPERLVRLSNDSFETAAVAGSIKRGEDAATDELLAHELWSDSKNRVEHAVVVDRIVQQLQSIADLEFAATPSLLKTPQIQHLYTPIRGRLFQATGLIELLRRLHPTPALGGMPNEWAQEKIKSAEIKPRGLFAAPIGYLNADGTGEFVVGIRSMWEKNKQVTLFAGAGILPDSDLVQESAEIQLKMTPMKELIEAQL